MTYQNLKKKTEGFTIIEVLIVLAIAGLIMLIVFLAVPALQRNSRNTAIKNDVASVLGGVSEFQGANSGRNPTAIAGTGTVSYTASGLNQIDVNVQGTTVVATVTSVSYPNPGRINVRLGVNCAGSPTTRGVVAYFKIERSGTPVDQCQES